jgi:hypothetical protein
MSIANFPSHIHMVPARDGVLLFKGLTLLHQYGNDLFNQGLRNNNKVMQDMACKLIAETLEVMHRQFDSYAVDHISQPIFQHHKKPCNDLGSSI